MSQSSGLAEMSADDFYIDYVQIPFSKLEKISLHQAPTESFYGGRQVVTGKMDTNEFLNANLVLGRIEKIKPVA